MAHCSLTVHVRAPIFVARQLQKHQVGLAWNEVSRRYVDDPPAFYAPDTWRARADDKKQGSSDVPVIGVELEPGVIASPHLRRVSAPFGAHLTPKLKRPRWLGKSTPSPAVSFRCPGQPCSPALLRAKSKRWRCESPLHRQATADHP